jgi:hypothetical protein
VRLSRGFHAKLSRVNVALRAGHATDARRDFDIFWRETRRTWRGMAQRLYLRWTPPAGCSPDDVEQELSMAVWNLLDEGKYDVTKGRTLADYLVFNACNRAKYWLHQQRGASLHGNRDKNPTRAPISVDTQYAAQPDRPHKGAAFVLARMRTEATQEHEADRRLRLLNILDDCTNLRERFALVSLYFHGGNEQRAAQYIYNDQNIRQLCRFGSEQQALTSVRRTIHHYARLEG